MTSRHPVAGARASVLEPTTGLRFSGEAAGSDTYPNFAVLASGTHVFDRPALWQASYVAIYRHENQPIEGDTFRQRYGFAWASAATRPLSALGAPFRYGGQFEHGFQESGLTSKGFESDTRYSSLKLLSGFSGGRGPHDYALTLGVGLGAGGGIRLTLGSVASFMLGYAANPNRGPGEPHGAVVFELKIHNLIR